MALEGMIPITPSSIAVAGGGSETGTINANGGVDFSACSDISLNGVFSSTYANYVIYLRFEEAAGSPSARLRLRASGSDATGTDYTRQYMSFDGTTNSGSQSTGDTEFLNVASPAASPSTSAAQILICNPGLAEETSLRSVVVSAYLGGYILDTVGFHELSTAYDGFTLFRASEEYTGNIRVFAFEES